MSKKGGGGKACRGGIPSTLDTLHRANGVAGIEMRVYLRYLDVDDVAERFGCVAGDADCACDIAEDGC